MLSPYRVLDLTNERGMLCGQMLADLGADVIAIEPPGGNSARKLGPFAGDEADPERSLYWWAYARNKRSVTLDLTTDEGRDGLLRLAEGAHFLIESEQPGRMTELGLGYEELAKVNPALVYVSISAFGQDGPKAGYAESDLIVEAAGGNLILQGDDDRPPVRVSVPQGYLHASAEAAGAALIAHHERQRSGRGQHVDVSAQQAVNLATFGTSMAVPFETEERASRVAGGLKIGPLVLRLVYQAKDGFVAIALLFGSAIGPFTCRLLQYIYEEGGCDEATRDKDFVNYGELLMTGKEPISELFRVQDVVGAFAATKTKAELLEAALDRSLLIAPVATIDDVIQSEQLAFRDYWREIDSPLLGKQVRYPGPFAKLTATPITYRRPTPTIGEHNDEVLGASVSPVTTPTASQDEPAKSALADIKILDFMWVRAGPAATRVLADYGAVIVRVESTTRIDTGRTMGLYQNGEVGPENANAYQNWNAGKLGITLDMTKEEGRAVARDLVRWADVVTESFSPKAMRSWGFDYESLRKIKPDVIMLSSCLMGQSGPLSILAGYGNLSSAIVGYHNITGWPDRPPAGPFLAYTDTVSPRFTVALIMAAIDHRERTGEGQYIDQSQAEAALHFMSPALLDYTVNGRVQGRDGNHDAHMAPHGVYPAAGDDRWVAIAVRSDEDWRTFCQLTERPDIASDSRYSSLEARLAHRDELDEIVGEWTKTRDAGEIEALLQAGGIAAYVVQGSDELFADPQLQHRGHLVEVAHPIHGTTTVEGTRFRLSRTPAKIERGAPTFGQHSQHILETFLGYDADKIAALAAASVLE